MLKSGLKSSETSQGKSVRHKVCQSCANLTDVKILYEVRGLKICPTCCERELKAWNAMVAEAEMHSAPQPSVADCPTGESTAS